MKTITFLILVVTLGFSGTLTAQQQKNERQAKQIPVFSKNFKTRAKTSGDTLWVIDSSYNFASNTEGLYINTKWYATGRNDAGFVTSGLSKSYSENEDRWVNDHRDSTTYYGDTLEKELYDYTWDDSLSAWKETGYRLFREDRQPEINLHKTWERHLHRYIYGYRYNSLYDDNDKLTEYQYYNYDTAIGDFVQKSRSYYYYDSYGYDSLMLSQVWDSTTASWSDFARKTGEYNPEEQKIILTYQSSEDGGQTWFNQMQDTYYYLENNLLDTVINATWQSDPGFWLFTKKTYYKYNENNKITETVRMQYNIDNSMWINQQRIVYVFNGDHVTRIDEDSWDETAQEWVTGAFQEIVFDGTLPDYAYYVTLENGEPDTLWISDYQWDEHQNLNKVIVSYPDENGILKPGWGYQYFWNIFQPSFVEENSLGEFLVYPNPTNGIIHISDRENSSTTLHLDLFDMQGKLLLSSDGQKTIDLRGKAPGTYLLQISGNRKFSVKQIVVK